jgi:peptidyl-prolyl cis-trans isomerase A (cyclophilin A)
MRILSPQKLNFQGADLSMRKIKYKLLLSVLLAALVFSAASQAAPADKRKPGLYWTIDTDNGKIVCKLYEAEAPVTVRTMVGLAIGKISYTNPETKQVMRNKFFDGLIFHRVIPPVMIQGGDILGTGSGRPEGPGFPYKSEIAASLKFDVPGRLAMANTGPDKNDTQFFITGVAYPAFNGKYTIWGQCENVDVVKAIAQVPRGAGDRPNSPVRIQHVTVERVGPAPADAPEAMAPDSPGN